MNFISKIRFDRKIIFFLWILVSANVLSVAQTIDGEVYDQTTNEPIIGATVMEIGTEALAITDIDGTFKLPAKNKSGKITVKYIGYKDETVSFESGKSLKIYMTEDSEMIEELVVIGYGTQRKSDLTGSVSSISTEDINKIPVTNVAQALQGKASGVEIVQNSGAPGSSTSVRIRGMGTINNSDPLYVVDGIPMDNINYLSADDIASIEILKDASSASIYGSRGANGVVLISTKDGKNSDKKININFSSHLGFQEIWKTPDILSKDDYMFFSDYVANQYIKTELSNGQLAVKPEFQGMLDDGNNWFDLVTRNLAQASLQKYSLVLTGGDKKLNYYLSGNYQKTNGIVKESDYDRKSLNVKINTKPADNLSLSANLVYANEDRQVVSEGTWGIIKTAINYNPLIPVYDINGSHNWGTPVENLRRTTHDVVRKSLIGQISLDWNILKELTFSSRASYQNYNSERKEFLRYNTNPEIVGNMRFDVRRTPDESSNIAWDNILTYAKVISDHDFSVMAGQTMEISDYSQSKASATGYGGYSDYYDALALASYSQAVGGYSTMWRSLSFLGRVNYSYQGKYLFQSNFRADGSSRFTKKNRWGFFPSASVGWKINAEPFMADLDFFSLLKLRAGWGQLGNNRIGNFAYQTLVGQNGQYIYGSGIPSIKNGMSIVAYGNENIRWERTESVSLGIDINLLSNRITSSFDVFKKKTSDMLIAVPIVYSAGYSSIPLQNAGEVDNQGMEFQLSFRESVGNFKFEVGGNITYIKNKIVTLGSKNEPILGGELKSPNPLGYVNRTEVGIPIGCFYGYKTDGILGADDFDSSGRALVPVFSSSTPFKAGDMKFVDVNKDGKIDENDQTYLGSPHPDLFYGFNVNLEYKGFDLQLFFQGVSGNKIYNVMKFFQYSSAQYDGKFNYIGNNFSNASKDYFDKVYRPSPNSATPTYRDNWGANLSGTVPAPSSDDSRNQINFSNSDFYIEDGSYLRLKNVQLGYNFSTEFCKKIKVKNLRLFGSISNLFTVTNYSGLDPEVGKKIGEESNNLFIGIDEGTYPQARTYLFGLVFDF